MKPLLKFYYLRVEGEGCNNILLMETTLKNKALFEKPKEQIIEVQY